MFNRYLDVKTFQIVKEQPICKTNDTLALQISVNTRSNCFTIFRTARRREVMHIVRYVSRLTTPLCGKWWSLAGSNRRPSACKADALPAELRPHCLSIFRLSFVAAFARSVTWPGHAPSLPNSAPRQTKTILRIKPDRSMR